MAQGVRRIIPSAMIDLIPMADGGQGTVDAVLASTPGQRPKVTVTGPLGEPAAAEFALLQQGEVALFEMACASGLERVPLSARNPMKTTTYGTGELLLAAIDSGAKRILIGIGGSATNDGGIGLAQAIGFRMLDHAGNEVSFGGDGLLEIDAIDPTNRDPRIDQVSIEVACDVTNPLTGPSGASAIYGPQKGATPDMVRMLDEGLSRLAEIVRRDLGIHMDGPGAGAAGGLGGGLVAFAGARLKRGIDIVIEAVDLRHRLEAADLCLTGEGRMDSQSSFGKTASGVAAVAKEMGVPTVAIVGARMGEPTSLHELGITAIFDATPGPMSLSEAVDHAPANIAYVAEQVARFFLSGHRTQSPGNFRHSR
jgi:glycerate kinase